MNPFQSSPGTHLRSLIACIGKSWRGGAVLAMALAIAPLAHASDITYAVRLADTPVTLDSPGQPGNCGPGPGAAWQNCVWRRFSAPAGHLNVDVNFVYILNNPRCIMPAGAQWPPPGTWKITLAQSGAATSSVTAPPPGKNLYSADVANCYNAAKPRVQVSASTDFNVNLHAGTNRFTLILHPPTGLSSWAGENLNDNKVSFVVEAPRLRPNPATSRLTAMEQVPARGKLKIQKRASCEAVVSAAVAFVPGQLDSRTDRAGIVGKVVTLKFSGSRAHGDELRCEYGRGNTAAYYLQACKQAKRAGSSARDYICQP